MLLCVFLPSLPFPFPFAKDYVQACEVIGTVTKHGLEWSSDQHIQTNFAGVAACLEDTHLPLKVQGALALQEMVLALPSVREAVAPDIAKVVQSKSHGSPFTRITLMMMIYSTVEVGRRDRFGRVELGLGSDRRYVSRRADAGCSTTCAALVRDVYEVDQENVERE